MTKEKYPTKWEIVNCFSSGYYNSDWEKYAIHKLQECGGDFITIIWERHIALYHIEKKVEQIHIKENTKQRKRRMGLYTGIINQKK